MAEHSPNGPQPVALRVIRMASVTAHKLRASAVSRWSPGYTNHQRELADNILKKVSSTLNTPIDTPPAATWTVQHVFRTVTDMRVVMIGPADGASVAVLKMPHTEHAVLGLARHCAALTELHADGRLGDWRALIPRLFAKGAIDGQHYAIEQAMPGCNAQSLMTNPVLTSRILFLAGQAIDQLHKATALPLTIDESVFERWVNVPLQTLNYWNERLPSSLRYDDALKKLSAQLHHALVGLSLSSSWIHGDFACANMLTMPDGTAVTGIIDWELATANDLPQLDQVQLLIAARLVLRGRQLGNIMIELLKGGNWLPYEQAILDDGQLPGDKVNMRTLLLLTWLRHVAANLTKSTRYIDNYFWETRNIKPVLQNL